MDGSNPLWKTGKNSRPYRKRKGGYWKLYKGVPRTIPKLAHPLVQELIRLMIQDQVSYQNLEDRGGAKYHSCMREWRRGRGPQLKEIEASFHALHYTLKPVPMGDKRHMRRTVAPI